MNIIKNHEYSDNEAFIKLLTTPVSKFGNARKIRAKQIAHMVKKDVAPPRVSRHNLKRVISYFGEDYTASEVTAAVLDRALITQESDSISIRDYVNTETIDKMRIEAMEDTPLSVQSVGEGQPKPTSDVAFRKSYADIVKSGVMFPFTEEMLMRSESNLIGKLMVKVAKAFTQFEEKFIISALMNGVIDGSLGRTGNVHDSLTFDLGSYDDTSLDYEKLVDMSQISSDEQFMPTNLMMNQKTLSILMKGEKETNYNQNWKYSTSQAMQFVVARSGDSPLFPQLLNINKLGVTNYIPDGQVLMYDMDYLTYYIRRAPRSTVEPFNGRTDTQDITFNSYFGAFYSNRNHAILGKNAAVNTIPDERFIVSS